jgi:hypothetical protein
MKVSLVSHIAKENINAEALMGTFIKTTLELKIKGGLFFVVWLYSNPSPQTDSLFRQKDGTSHGYTACKTKVLATLTPCDQRRDKKENYYFQAMNDGTDNVTMI